jgi:hypothetical protein
LIQRLKNKTDFQLQEPRRAVHTKTESESITGRISEQK